MTQGRFGSESVVVYTTGGCHGWPGPERSPKRGVRPRGAQSTQGAGLGSSSRIVAVASGITTPSVVDILSSEPTTASRDLPSAWRGESSEIGGAWLTFRHMDWVQQTTMRGSGKKPAHRCIDVCVPGSDRHRRLRWTYVRRILRHRGMLIDGLYRQSPRMGGQEQMERTLLGPDRLDARPRNNATRHMSQHLRHARACGESPHRISVHDSIWAGCSNRHLKARAAEAAPACF